MIKKQRSYKTFIFKTILLIVSVILLISAGVIIWIITMPLPDFESYFEDRKVEQSTKIFDRTGEHLLFNVHGDIKRTVVPLEKISPYIIGATLAIEDAEFYHHRGVRPMAVIRANIINLMSGQIKQGGSTLTQQTVKNTLLTQDQTITRKIKEMILSLKLEQTMTKDEILSMYLNESPYGGNVYGVQEAALRFFNKDASEVSIAEAAYLAALPQAPTFLSPYGSNQSRLDNRQELVLRRMKQLGVIDEEEYQEAQAEKVTFAAPDSRGIKAPHFVFYVIENLVEKYGEEALMSEGLEVITTLDWEMQQKAEKMVKEYVDDNVRNFQGSNAGLVALDPKNGGVLAMVGSRDYFDTENDGNYNIALAKRQPGSSFKPFVYAEAFNQGFTPETVVFDLRTEFSTGCTWNSQPRRSGAQCYSPANYDGRFVGPINLKNALAQSRNVPAVKTQYLAGSENTIQLANELGISTLSDHRLYGLTLVLGGGEIRLLDMVGGYGAFAQDGMYHEPTGIKRIINHEQETIFENEFSGKKVLPTNTARQISDILSDNTARSAMFGPNSVLNVGRNVAVKTGTTNNHRDAWTFGYTPEIVVGVWAGNNDNTPMARTSASAIIAPLWNRFMREYLAENPSSDFTPPQSTSSNAKPVLRGIWEGSESYFIDTISGKLATEYTPEETKEEVFLNRVRSILYWVDRNDPTGPPPGNPEQDSQFDLWNTPVRLWAASQGFHDEDQSDIPEETDDVHIPENFPQVEIELTPESIESATETVEVELEIESTFDPEQVEVFVNNSFLISINNQLTNFPLPLEDIEDQLRETNNIRVVVYDSVKNRGEAETTLKIEEIEESDEDEDEDDKENEEE